MNKPDRQTDRGRDGETEIPTEVALTANTLVDPTIRICPEMGTQLRCSNPDPSRSRFLFLDLRLSEG